MKIVHFVPFAPNACGLYEAARDMAVADFLSGHDSHVVDVGVTSGGVKAPAKIGAIDNRGGNKITAINPETVYDADVIIAHTGVPDNWIVQCQAPIIWVIHGRPAVCFSPEQFGRGHSYSLIAKLAQWPRVKAMLNFWPRHVKFWEPIIPKNKLVTFPVPPIDLKRFSIEGNIHDFGKLGGKFNVMICESWREDVDIYEMTHGAIEFAKINKDTKFHFWGMETQKGTAFLLKCWDLLIAELRKYDAVGELMPRRTDINEIYRAADLVLSPQKIVTRTIGEALACGTPVIAARECEYATYTASPDNPVSVCKALGEAMFDFKRNKAKIINRVKETAKMFSLMEYSKRINKLYEEITK